MTMYDFPLCRSHTRKQEKGLGFISQTGTNKLNDMLFIKRDIYYREYKYNKFTACRTKLSYDFVLTHEGWITYAVDSQIFMSG